MDQYNRLLDTFIEKNKIGTYYLIETEIRRLYKRFDYPTIIRLKYLLNKINYNLNFEIIKKIKKIYEYY